MAKPTAPFADRFWAKVNKTETCWLWTAALNATGYGVLGRGRRGAGNVLAHRAAWELTKGPLTPDQVLDHKCHTRACVNPAHLQVVTHGLNNQNRRGAQTNSKSGIRGVHWIESRGKYEVRAKVGGRRHFAGYFDDVNEAAAAAVELRNRVMTNNLADRSGLVPEQTERKVAQPR